MATKVLKFIGKGQVTIPQEWRSVLGMQEEAVKATLQGNKIIIEPLPLHDEKTWKTEIISLNNLPKNEQKLIKKGRNAYKKGEKQKFLTAAEFFKSE